MLPAEIDSFLPKQELYRRVRLKMREAFAGHWKRTFGVLLIALALRLYFALACPHVAGDSPIYEAFARNLLESGTYSHLQYQNHSAPKPTMIRVPGYPLMIAAVFAAAGTGNETAVRVLQAVLDTFACVLIALIAFEISSGEIRLRRRRAQWTLALAAVCPFCANYSASILTEVPTTLLWTAAVLFGLKALKNASAGRNWLYCGLLAGGATLFRPESGILVGIIGIVLFLKEGSRKAWGTIIKGACLMGFGLILALLPWAARNAWTLHSFQPLAPTYAQDKGETVTYGYYDWCRGWLWKYQDVVGFIFPVETENLPTGPLPSGSFDGEDQRQTILQMIRNHNKQGNYIAPESDRTFQFIAGENRRNHPFRYHVLLPVLRSAAMWFTPRVEILNLEGRLLPLAGAWENDPVDFSISLFLFLINIFYIALGIWGAVSILKRPRSWDHPEFLGCFALLAVIVVRTGFFALFAFPEPRYVLEAYPAVIALGAFAFIKIGTLPPFTRQLL
jgi:4-amino-4-deoxy-L-arabinose transferase-like glycosyltransferase